MGQLGTFDASAQGWEEQTKVISVTFIFYL